MDRPAEQSRISSLPNRRTVSSTANLHASAEVTSVGMTSAFWPKALISLAASSSALPVRAAKPTCAPSCAMRMAVARPRPDDAPVMSAILPPNDVILRLYDNQPVRGSGVHLKSVVMNDVPEFDDLCPKIARLVEERGWNQEEFARFANLNRLTIRKIFL